MNRLIYMQVLCPSSTLHLWKDIRLYIIRVVEDNKKIWKNIYPCMGARSMGLKIHTSRTCELADVSELELNLSEKIWISQPLLKKSF